MPKSATLSSAVETATKCFATASFSSWPASPSSSQALQSRALVSVSSVPKVLLETMNSVRGRVEPGQGRGGVGRVDVADEPALEAVLAVRLERLVGHHRPEVGAADADVDDRADPLAGDAGPRAGADLVGEVVDPARARRARRATTSWPSTSSVGAAPGSRSAVCSTARSSVTLMCSPRNIASRRSATPDLLGQGEQGGQHVVVDEPLGQVDVQVGRGEGQPVDARPGSSANHAAQVRAANPPARLAEPCPRLGRRASTGPSVTGRCSIWPSTVSTSSSQDFLNLSTPSVSSTTNTSSRSMPTAAELVEQRLRLVAPAGHQVALDLAVVGERVERLLGHRVDGVGDDQVGDVERVGVVRVLHAGRRPQRALRVGAGVRELLPAVARDDLLVRRVGEPGVGDRRLAAQRQWPRRVPIASSRLSTSVSTRDTKNDATDWIRLRSRPASRAASRPDR